MHIHIANLNCQTGAQWLSGRVLGAEELRVRASPALVRCALEQDTLILA